MILPAQFDRVFSLEHRLGASWPYIHAAHDNAVAVHAKLGAAVDDVTGEDASIVVVGSLGRFEKTSESDVDWTYLVDRQADLRHQATLIEADRRIKTVSTREPGREGVFGAMAFSHDLPQYIGGQEDTNSNLTRRILMLLESKPVGRIDAYKRVVEVVLERYLTGDHGWIRSRTPLGVPRFLYNDIARYWRTVAVDYAYKQWTRDNKGWALRSAKLRMSRKLTYAAGMLYCFQLSQRIWTDAPAAENSARKLEAIDRLWKLTLGTPLNLLADAFLQSDSLAAAAKKAFGAYDVFLSMLDDTATRDYLKELPAEQADTDDVYARVRELGLEFEDGLFELFTKDDSTPFPELTAAYGVF